MKDVVPHIHGRLQRLLRWRVWVSEKLRPSPWQETLIYAALAGIAGALISVGFRRAVDFLHYLLTGTDEAMVELSQQKDAVAEERVRIREEQGWAAFKQERNKGYED